MRIVVALVALLAAWGCAAPRPPPANPADVATIDAVVAAVYDSISGRQAAPRDWDRFLSLFHPDAAVLLNVNVDLSGVVTLWPQTPPLYVESASNFFSREGFFETELARRVERFGHIAHVFSTYEARRDPELKPYARGINSIQLLWDGERWWIVSIFWDVERPGMQIPEEYLLMLRE